MTVSLSETGEFLSVSGNTCPRGASYARQECTLPERMITAVIPVHGRTRLLDAFIDNMDRSVSGRLSRFMHFEINNSH